jgi:hypothetical protein
MKLPSDLGFFRECAACGATISHLPQGCLEIGGHTLALCGHNATEDKEARKGCKDRHPEQALALTLGRLESGAYQIAATVGDEPAKP